jgi:hypothetical protein
MPKYSAKEMINPNKKRITIFCIDIRPGRSASRQPRPGRPDFSAARPINNTRKYDQYLRIVHESYRPTVQLFLVP